MAVEVHVSNKYVNYTTLFSLFSFLFFCCTLFIVQTLFEGGVQPPVIPPPGSAHLYLGEVVHPPPPPVTPPHPHWTCSCMDFEELANINVGSQFTLTAYTYAEIQHQYGFENYFNIIEDIWEYLVAGIYHAEYVLAHKSTTV